jgi:catechol 2,3-dioxygenase-like lactoylglutathione lyase family enzyme
VGAIDHVDLVVSSLERSLPFYRGLLEPLGYTDVGDIEGEQFDRYALGLHHLALAAPDREAVDCVEVVHR